MAIVTNPSPCVEASCDDCHEFYEFEFGIMHFKSSEDVAGILEDSDWQIKDGHVRCCYCVERLGSLLPDPDASDANLPN